MAYRSNYNKAKKIRKKIDSILTELASTNYFVSEFQNTFETFLKSLGDRQIAQLICYGLGSFEGALELSSKYQIALLILVHTHLAKIQSDFNPFIEIYDPIFSPVDIRVLQSFTNPKFRIIPTNELCARQLDDLPDGACNLFFMPHCDIILYENLLGVNWDSKKLARLAILGNSFTDMVDSIIENKLKFDAHYLRSLVANFEKIETPVKKRGRKRIKKEVVKQPPPAPEPQKPKALIELTVKEEGITCSAFHLLTFQCINLDWLGQNEHIIEQHFKPTWKVCKPTP